MRMRACKLGPVGVERACGLTAVEKVLVMSSAYLYTAFLDSICEGCDN